MPTYEYVCEDCGRNIEVKQNFSDEPLTNCESCQGQLRKVFGRVGISFKGSGFYKNDSRKSTSGNKKKNESVSSDKKVDVSDSATTPAKKSTDKTESTNSSASTKATSSAK